MEIRKKAVEIHSLLKHPACGRQAIFPRTAVPRSVL